MAFSNSSAVEYIQDDFDYEFYIQQIRQKFYVATFIIILIVGLLANGFLLSQTILWIRPARGGGTPRGGALSGLLLNLTIAGLLWFTVLLPIFVYIDVRLGPRWHLSEGSCRFLNYANYVTVFGLIYSLVLVVIYQSVCVIYPRKIARYNHPRTALIICGVLWLLLLACNIATAFQYQLVEYASDINFCLLYHDSWESAKRHILLRQAFAFTLPFLVMVCCSVYLIGTLCAPDSASLYQQLQEEEPNNGGARMQRRASGMLVALTLCFGLCCTPWAVTHVAIFLSPNNYHLLRKLSVQVTLDVFYCLYKANPAINPIIIYLCMKDEMTRPPRRPQAPPPPPAVNHNGLSPEHEEVEGQPEAAYNRDDNVVQISLPTAEDTSLTANDGTEHVPNGNTPAPVV